MSAAARERIVFYRVSRIGLSIALAVVRSLPRFSVGILSSLVAWTYLLVNRRERRILRRNLKEVLGVAESRKLRRMMRAVAHHQFVSGIESVQGIYDRDRVVLEGVDSLREILRRAEDCGRGQVIVTSHFGSWELVGVAASSAGQKDFYALAKKAPNPAVTEFLAELRRRGGAAGVLWTGRRSILKEMLLALRRGETLAIVMDQKPEDLKGREARFFGRPTVFVGGPGRLAVKTQCAVIALSVVRLGPFHYRAVAEEVAPAGHESNDEDELTQKMVDTLEGHIRQWPEQWCWNYRRWPDLDWRSN